MALWDAATGDPRALPIQNVAEGRTSAFSPDGLFLAVALADHTVRFFPVPPSAPAPPWLADLADFAASQTTYAQGPKADVSKKIERLRTQLLASKSENAWDKFGRWYFSESAGRPVIPGSTLSLQEYVDSLIALGDKDSLDYAISLSRGQSAWMVKLVPLRAKFDAPAPR